MSSVSTDPRTPLNTGLAHDDVRGYTPRIERRVSWAAVIAGSLMAIALMVLLAMLGTGIGASTIDPLASGDGTPSASTFGIAAAAWWAVSTLISLFVGGWVAGRLSGVPFKAEGGLHGLLTWAIALLATVYLVGSGAGTLLSTAGGILGTVATVSATGAAAAAPKLANLAGDQLQQAGVSLDSIKADAMQLLRQTGKPALQPGAISQQAQADVADARSAGNTASTSDQDFSSMLDRFLAQAKGTASQADQTAIVNVVMARTGLTREQATQRVNGWQATAEQARAKAAEALASAKQTAREAADASAKAVSRAMLLGFLALAIGAVVAWFGGTLGQVRRTVVA